MNSDQSEKSSVDNIPSLETIILKRLLRLNAVATGLTVGVLSGLGLFLLTIILVIKGGPVVGPNLALLGQYFPGYTVTAVGSLVGFAYAFITGFVIGFSLAFLYNLFLGLREKASKSHTL